MPRPGALCVRHGDALVHVNDPSMLSDTTAALHQMKSTDDDNSSKSLSMEIAKLQEDARCICAVALDKRTSEEAKEAMSPQKNETGPVTLASDVLSSLVLVPSETRSLPSASDSNGRPQPGGVATMPLGLLLADVLDKATQTLVSAPPAALVRVRMSQPLAQVSIQTPLDANSHCSLELRRKA